MAHHGTLARHPRPDCLKSPGSGDPGLFGRLFDLPPLVVDDTRLLALAKAMRDVDDQDADTQGDAKLPAGFTYLGQFIDHDVTLDTTPLTARIDDPDAVENFRTPGLDLDSVYGLGPEGSPHLYERDAETLIDRLRGLWPRLFCLSSWRLDRCFVLSGAAAQPDLWNGRAIMGLPDPRASDCARRYRGDGRGAGRRAAVDA
jgi:hypothetical protein